MAILVDVHGWAALIVTIIIVAGVGFKFKIYKNLSDRLEKLQSKDSLKVFIILILLLIGFFSLWLTVRITGFYFVRYLYYITNSSYNENNTINGVFQFTTSNSNYNKNDIFQILTFALTTNLIFTLVNAFLPKLPDNNNNTNLSSEQDAHPIKDFMLVAIQAVIIGLITFIPRNGNIDLTEMNNILSGTITYAIIIGILISALFIFVYLHEKINTGNSLI